ncbi:MAG: type I-E CRISPR-associated protein Cse2/CasB [Chloroflexi bacterium]|nr:type I-E CRISPR-associated protein Cse2/CasB [Chloroflexota bacterium]MCI0579297.1 type I-E CRISPR-associated protein Cse2/CasB [Chloroflexota bacterium]MCI0649357.1 type I-E CRISPR-associated protein Cse2/CasB [Chloroflexota bacterium]MCI0726654.1 type I-E CRISPR-associated protein Cse2/CasB [Chloroflexota bacterium]
MIEERKRRRDEQIGRFLENLAGLDDGERALLKRSAGQTLAESGRAMFLFFQKLLPYGVPRRQEESYFLLATLYPFDKRQRQARQEQEGEAAPAVERIGGLGDSLRRARNEQNETGFNRRLARLLDADAQQLPFQLRQAVMRLANDWVPINWAQLAEDVLNWDRPGRYVQKEWAREYVAPQPQVNER